MKRNTTIALVGVLVVALAAMPLGAASVGTALQDETDDTDNDEIAPGERLSGVVAVQDAELSGEVSERAYGVKLAQAETDEAKAAVVDEQVEDVDERLTAIEERLEELEAAREAGEISHGQYRAEVAKLAAERATAERLAEGANATASDLPADLLEERGVDAEAIGELRERADELNGSEVSEIARSIAGEGVGQPPVADREPGAPLETPGQSGDETPGDGPAASGNESDDRPGAGDPADAPGNGSDGSSGHGGPDGDSDSGPDVDDSDANDSDANDSENAGAEDTENDSAGEPEEPEESRDHEA
ncbi:hypothetical protein SAMN05444422_10886 [Halobiforma haloterrestris]|uniref:Uncharacterized protein n=1 Tax=Natronobacterium haloterrestre TaxID=148448 RepID=A0A1I1J8X8_NATHA|nr:hypothetical protein [Halobiforma haloterrestris]SFC42383.1 hypothetical protein SAMN05444422_10886 [Halobiforma haloterrestris]